MFFVPQANSISKYSSPNSSVLVSLHKGMINISSHMVGRLEYWNTGILGQKSERSQFGKIKMPVYLMKLVVVRNPSFHHSIIPLFHYSIIPLFPSNNLLAKPIVSDLSP